MSYNMCLLTGNNLNHSYCTTFTLPNPIYGYSQSLNLTFTSVYEGTDRGEVFHQEDIKWQIMRIENKMIEKLNVVSLQEGKTIFISKSIIQFLNFDANVFNGPVVIEECIIGQVYIHAAWFTNGLHLKNNHFTEVIDYEMGGHNEKPIIIENNIFCDFFNFFDCQFKDVIEVRNNIFLKDSNLLGNTSLPVNNSFDSELFIEGNIGKLDVDGFGGL